MFAYELNRRLAKAGYTTFSVAAHPDVAATNLTQHLPAFLNLFRTTDGLVLNNASHGALPTSYAALGDDIRAAIIAAKRKRQMRGAPIKVGSNRASRDETAATKLWAMSE
ncbi:MAG: hypothetical protein IPP41_07620 [Rhodocyclaceae bacterium]|nr:hypothetical protein [Rhodocyclaceae bacterium]